MIGESCPREICEACFDETYDCMYDDNEVLRLYYVLMWQGVMRFFGKAGALGQHLSGLRNFFRKFCNTCRHS